MYKVFLGVGHGGSDSGACGNGLQEKTINLNIASACKAELEKHGITVKLSRETDTDDPINEEVKKCNAFNPDLAIDIHTNAGGGKGFECFYSIVGGLGKALAQNIESEIKAIGQNSRGTKTKTLNNTQDFYCFIRETKAHAVICECAFIDNHEDIKMINTLQKQQSFGIAYAKGILKTLGISDQANTKLSIEQFIDKIKMAVLNESKRINILASITFAQAILESQNGNSELAINANNLFGIKASNWTGQTYTKLTNEVIKGQNISVQADFRKYNSWGDSIKDHSNFLLKDRYKNLICERDYKKACNLLLQDGYATDPNYPTKLINIIEKYKLYEYDQNNCPQYKLDGEYYLRLKGYTTDEHDPREVVDFGTLGIILMNFDKVH